MGERGGSLNLVPREGAPVDRAFDGFEQNHGEHLAIGKALDPDIGEQPIVLVLTRITPFKRESQRRSQEVDHQEAEEVNDELLKSRGIGGIRMKMAINQIP